MTYKPEHHEPKMAVYQAVWWAEVLAENLTDGDYTVAGDDATHFKIAAIRRLIERNEELESALEGLTKQLDDVAKAISKVT